MKSSGTWMKWVLLPVVIMAGCIAFDVDEAFCENATVAQQQAICGRDAGTPGTPDAGVDASCGSSSSCGEPPGQCYESRGTCVSGRCEYALKQTGAACNDATPKSACHSTSGTCEAGVCQSSLQPMGTACDDGQLCTVRDTCDSAGRCVGGSPFVCDAPPTQCHQQNGTCTNNTCVYPLKTAGASCEDGDKCTEADQCNSAGICVGKARSCTTPTNPCYQSTGTCDASSGACQYVPQSAGSPCEAGNLCKEDVCDGSGRCVQTTTDTTCENRSEFCMTNTACSPSAGCQYTYRCTANEICQNGTCCRPSTASNSSNAVPGNQCIDLPPEPIKP